MSVLKRVSTKALLSIFTNSLNNVSHVLFESIGLFKFFPRPRKKFL